MGNTNDLPPHLAERRAYVRASMDLVENVAAAAVDSAKMELSEKIDLIERLRAVIMGVRTVGPTITPTQAAAGFGPRRRTA